MKNLAERAENVIYRLQELHDWALDDKAACAIVTAAIYAERQAVYKEIADEFHIPLGTNINETARGLAAQLEAIFLRRAQETP